MNGGSSTSQTPTLAQQVTRLYEVIGGYPCISSRDRWSRSPSWAS
jgi:hypothetical protein